MDPYLLLMLCALPGALISFIARQLLDQRVKANQVPNLVGMTGAEVARAILAANQITDVRVEKIAGNLTDHYSPKEKVLRLSDVVHDQKTVTALGVAAHEVGHAIQDAEKYGPLVLRQTVAPFAVAGQKVAMGTMMGGVGLTTLFASLAHQTGSPIFTKISMWITIVACVLFSLFVFFTLVTLPVEYDASDRAVKQLAALQLSGGDEWFNTQKVLNAAALTYVAAAAAAIGMFLSLLIRSQTRR